MVEESEELLGNDATAIVLHVKPLTLATWRCKGYGPAFIKVGRKVFYRRADIAAWLAAQRREPGKAGSPVHGNPLTFGRRP